MIAEISTRYMFDAQDDGWADYVRWIGLDHLSQVKTMDSMLNSYVNDCGDLPIELSELDQCLGLIPVPSSDRQYVQLKIMLEEHETIPQKPGFHFLGVDLADITHTSSILNCGKWENGLVRFSSHINQYGLLNLDAARAVQAILPDEWDDDGHAFVDCWAIYERAD